MLKAIMCIKIRKGLKFLNVAGNTAVFDWYGTKCYFVFSSPIPVFLKMVDHLTKDWIAEDELSPLFPNDAKTVNQDVARLRRENYLQALPDGQVPLKFETKTRLANFLGLYSGNEAQLHSWIEKAKKARIVFYFDVAPSLAFIKNILAIESGEMLLCFNPVLTIDRTALEKLISEFRLNPHSDLYFAQKKIEIVDANFESVAHKTDLAIYIGSWEKIELALIFNQSIRTTGATWFPVLLDPALPSLGPCFSGEVEFCLNCVVKRREINQTHFFKRHLVSHLNIETFDFESLMHPVLVNRIGSALHLEALNIITGFSPSNIFRGLLEVNPYVNNTLFHEILPFPFCEVCHPQSFRPIEV